MKIALAIGFALTLLSPIASSLDDAAAQYYADIQQGYDDADLWRYAYQAWKPSAPAGCIVQRVYEDHSARGVCAGSYVVGYDPDDGTWDIPYAIDTMILTDAHGNTFEFPVYD